VNDCSDDKQSAIGYMRTIDPQLRGGWSALNEESTDAMFELASRHYQETMRHETALVCCLLIDRKLCRSLRIKPSDMLDPFWSKVLSMLIEDNWVSLKKIVDGADESHAARTIADAIRCPVKWYDMHFVWNFAWHQHELKRLAMIRERFLASVDFILEYGELQ
jgi:hypothetical protein